LDTPDYTDHLVDLYKTILRDLADKDAPLRKRILLLPWYSNDDIHSEKKRTR